MLQNLTPEEDKAIAMLEIQKTMPASDEAKRKLEASDNKMSLQEKYLLDDLDRELDEDLEVSNRMSPEEFLQKILKRSAN